MAEYQHRSCGPCPYYAKFAPRTELPYLSQNTVPNPNIAFQDSSHANQHHLGVSTAYQSPDLKLPPQKEHQINYDIQNRQFTNEESVLRHEMGGMPNCLEAQKACCLPVENANNETKVEINCDTFNKNGSTSKPKGILKPSRENCCCPSTDSNQATRDINSLQHPATTTNQSSYQPPPQSTNIGEPPKTVQINQEDMHATAGRSDPTKNNNPEVGQLVPVPNALRPVGVEKPLCYLPQPEDTILAQQINEMGPTGPWATGKADWGPLAGLTGTRPVVDRYSITRYSEGEWRSHNKDILEEADTEQHRSNLIDWNGRQCLEQTQSDVDKNQEDNTRRLNQREMEILRWKCELERAIAASAVEIAFMEEQRRRLKQAAAVLQMPEAIAGECLERRTGRMDSELVRDEVEEELIKELSLCSEIRDIFSRTLKDIQTQLTEDRTAKQRLEYDWSDKQLSLEIDSLNASLDTRSTVLMFKPGAVIFPENQSTPEFWEHFTKETLLEGEATRQRSAALRGTLDAILINAARDLRSQADRVELALSKRIACTEEVTRKLEMELKQILRQLAEVEALIDALKSAIRRMDIPMKKAQTRLDNRLQRPRVENCRDTSHFGLVDEVKSIAENVAALQGQLGQALKSQENMIQTRNNLEREIMLKKKTLEIDNDRIRRIRSHYPSATALSGY
ncbi:tektin-4 [Sitophilus oryzae]|uniref:Tektin-4 n=1 Tax=Sitophilus oryzae TaxID=7048 RepID=A0A6J2X3V5_SITOR|nr:tektin-4 [Sitophilus oryzae]